MTPSLTVKVALLLAALALGLGPAQQVLSSICKMAPSGAQVADVPFERCDCEASGCGQGTPVFCGQCLKAASEATALIQIGPLVARKWPAIVDWRDGGLSLKPLVPPPELEA